jgi:lysyl-tRNA synthetase class 2
MLLVDVQSEAILSIGYDDAEHTLFIVFRDGDLYRYLNVPQELYRRFLNAESKGGFFAAQIRDRYEHQRLGPR